MPGLLVPSAQVAFITWALGNTPITDHFGNGVSAKVPTKGVTYPWAEVRRITGIAQLPEVPMDNARLQVSVLGGLKSNGQPNWDPADLGARIIEAEIRAFRGSRVSTEAYIAEMAPFEGMQQLEDPDTGEARFWMDLSCTVRRADGQ